MDTTAPKPTASVEHIDGRDIRVRCHDVFTVGDCFDVSFVRSGGDVHANGVQAIDDGRPVHADLAPEQHERLYGMGDDCVADAIAKWNWDLALDRAS